MLESLTPVITIMALVAAAGLAAWALSRGAWGPAALAVFSAVPSLALLWAVVNTPGTAPPRREDPIPGCEYAEFPICSPFQETWSAHQSWYGPAISTAALRGGFLTQCYVRACLSYFPSNSPSYQILPRLLGEDYLRKHDLTGDSPRDVSLSPLVGRWLSDKAKSDDLLRLIGEPIKGTYYDAEIGRNVAVFQMAVISFPSSPKTDIADVRLEPLGEWFNPAEPRPQAPWWAEAKLRVGLLLGSIASTLASALRILRGGFEDGGAF